MVRTPRDLGAIEPDWALGAEGALGSEGAVGAEGAEEDEGAAISVRWLGHHGNRLYGCMGLWSKMLEWMDGLDTP